MLFSYNISIYNSNFCVHFLKLKKKKKKTIYLIKSYLTTKQIKHTKWTEKFLNFILRILLPTKNLTHILSNKSQTIKIEEIEKKKVILVNAIIYLNLIKETKIL